MSEIVHLAERPEYLHALLCHFPVVGLGLAWVVLCVGLVVENLSLTRAGLVMQCVLSGLTLLVVMSGQRALEHLKASVDTATVELMEAHAMAGETWAVFYYVTAAVSLGAFVVAWRWPARLWWPSVVAAGLAMISLVAGITIAHSGGQVRHPEFRTSTTVGAVTPPPGESG